MGNSRVFGAIIRNIDQLVIDLLLPARSEKKVYRKAFDHFYRELDQLILALGEELQMPRELSGLLIMIYVDLASNIRRKNQESVLSKELKVYKGYLEQIFRVPFVDAETSSVFDEMKDKIEETEPAIAEFFIKRKIPQEISERLFACLGELKREIRGKESIPREIAGILFRIYTAVCDQVDMDDYEDPMLYIAARLEDDTTKILGVFKRWDRGEMD